MRTEKPRGGGLPLALALSVCLGACGSGEEQAVEGLEAADAVAYWVVKGKRGDNNHISPVVRFQIRNRGNQPADYVQTMAVFRLEDSPETAWGNAFEYSIAGDPIAPGQISRVITLRCDSTYYSKDDPARMFENEKWEQVFVDIFFRLGSSSWKLAHKMEVPKRLGAPGVDKFLTTPETEPQPEERPPTEPSPKVG